VRQTNSHPSKHRTLAQHNQHSNNVLTTWPKGLVAITTLSGEGCFSIVTMLTLNHRSEGHCLRLLQWCLDNHWTTCSLHVTALNFNCLLGSLCCLILHWTRIHEYCV